MDGKLYRRLRLAMGLSAAELGKELMISEEYISSMERGRRQVTDSQAQAIVALLMKKMRSNDPCFAKLRELMQKIDEMNL